MLSPELIYSLRRTWFLYCRTQFMIKVGQLDAWVDHSIETDYGALGLRRQECAAAIPRDHLEESRRAELDRLWDEAMGRYVQFKKSFDQTARLNYEGN